MTWINYHHLRYFWQVAREGNVSRAAKQLRVAQPTVSEQLRLLETMLGEKLLVRAGRGVALTEVGKTVYRFADQIFALGRELVDTLEGKPTERPRRLLVGIADVVPKLAAVRILEPVLALDPQVRLICHEDTPERLLDQLAAHELDLVLADAPIGAGRAYNHLLGECAVAIFGVPALARSARRRFPASLAELPFVLPTTDTALRRALDRWLDEHGIVPHVIAELQDSALIVELAATGAGLFAAPEVVMADALRARGLQRVGTIPDLRERYYAVTVERRLAHPAVVAIAGAARAQLFAL